MEEDEDEDLIGHDIYDEDDPEEYSFPHRMIRLVGVCVSVCVCVLVTLCVWGEGVCVSV
jgi:hypothetical protein